jgi:SAM-dependent methyltransferase
MGSPHLDRDPVQGGHWLGVCLPQFRSALQACAAGHVLPDMALLELARAAASAQELAAVFQTLVQALPQLTSASAVARLERLHELARSQPGAWDTVTKILGVVDHQQVQADASPAERLSHIRAAFDGAARLSPEASVALYALGDPGRLAAASAELVEQMRRWNLLGRDRVYLDIGCGIGRMERALAPELAFITGTDISPVMLQLARERCAGLANTAFQLANGEDLAGFGSASLDGVLAVDSFPYLVQCGMQLAERHIQEAARVLKPGGELLIYNFSYRGDLATDRGDVARLAVKAGLGVVRNGVQELQTWDGAAFQLDKR